jgi:Cu-processing system permease protein
MRTVFVVARDLIREAAARRWFLMLGGAITLLLATLALGLNMEVVDGALAATRFFGDSLSGDVRAADVALRPVFKAASYIIFYGGLLFGIVACADFGPGLLAPGRIEHLLSLPVSRASLLGGTLLGVWSVITIGALYGALGVTLILGVKTSVWSWSLVVTGLLASLSFVAVYGVMLCVAVFVRSASVSALAGLMLFGAGIVAGYRQDLAPIFAEEGAWRSMFHAVTTIVPPMSTIADTAAALSESAAIDVSVLLKQLAGLVIYGIASLTIAVWRFDSVDF